MSRPGSRLAVLGSPIAHSKSPALQRAAYEILGLDWSYEAVEVTGETLAEFVRTRDASWRGLSLTMPLKREIIPLLDVQHPLVEQTGSANTVLFGYDTGRRVLTGFNTDVYGIAEAFRRRGHTRLPIIQVLGGGATAASAIAAASLLGCSRVIVSVRSLQRAAPLVGVGEGCGVTVELRDLADAASIGLVPDAVLSTLPNGTAVGIDFPAETRARSVLFDVAYHPWPTELASRWTGEVIGGLEMLTLQALAQVRVFVGGDPEQPLEREPEVLAAMTAAVAR